MDYLKESSLLDLYQSTVAAFPHTRKRQHSVDTIQIQEVNFTPFLGMRTLFVRGNALNEENGNTYTPIILFKDVIYHPQKDRDEWTELVASDGRNYVFERLERNINDILVRCNCPDFQWRFNYFDHEDRSLYGRKRKRYEAVVAPGSANPNQMPGMCKHLIKLSMAIRDTGILG